MPPGLREAGVLLLGLFAIVAAAKVHGREVRLRREHEGHLRAGFRRENDPWVEALWRRDRIGFWSTFAGLAVAACTLALAGFLPLAFPFAVAVALGWAFAASFLAMGARWAIQLRRLGACPVWPTLGWFLLPAAFAAAEAALLWWPA